jgi:uncharacterized protein (DUF2267 family)
VRAHAALERGRGARHRRRYASLAAPLLQPCAQHQTTYGLEGFLRRVAAPPEVTPAEAEANAHMVFALLHERLPAKEIEEAASQLPCAPEDLWLSARPA